MPPPAATDADDVDVEGFLDGSLTPAALVARLVEAGLENASAASPSSAEQGAAPGQPGPVHAAACVLAEFDK